MLIDHFCFICILGRSDDNIITAKKRFQTFQESTMPVIEYFKNKGKLTSIQGNQSVESVWTDLKMKFEMFLGRSSKDCINS